MDLDNVKPVSIKAPTVIEVGDHDPYDAVRPVSNNAENRPSPDNGGQNKTPETGPAATPEKKVLPATAVNPGEENQNSLPTVKIDPPDPLEFN